MSRGFVIVLVALAAACSDEDRKGGCPIGMLTGTGSIRWLDGTVRLPDRVYVLYAGDREPRDCKLTPPAAGADAVAYSCPEGVGQGTLTVELDRERWDRPFAVNGCEGPPEQSVDLWLDPAAGRPF